MNESLYSEIVDLLLEDDEKPPEEKKTLNFDADVVALVDTAGHVVEPGAKSEKPKPPGVHVQQITVGGFRGIGPKAKPELRSPLELTLAAVPAAKPVSTANITVISEVSATWYAVRRAFACRIS